MTTAYSPLLGLALPVTGELSGTWGQTVNDSITSLLDSAVAGTTTLSTDADVTLTSTTGAANTAREAILLFSGARTALRTITAPAQSKIYTVINATTGGFSVKIVGAGPTAGVNIVAGESAVIAWNGTDFVKVSGSNTVQSFSGGTTGFTPSTSTTGAVTLSGTLVVTNGGTGLSSLTAGYIPYGNGTSPLSNTANFSYNGSTLRIGNQALLGGTTNPIVGMTGSANGYIQSYIWNTSNSASSSADFVAYPNNGLDTTGWVDMGITSQTYSDALYSVTGPNEAYLFGSAPSGSGTTGNLVYATDSTGTANAHQWYVGGFNQAKGGWKMQLTSTGLTLLNNPTLSGGTANGVAYLNGSKVLTTGSALTFDPASRFNLVLASATATPSWNAVDSLRVTGSSAGENYAYMQLHSGVASGSSGYVFAVGSTRSIGGMSYDNNTNALMFSQNSNEGMRLTSTGLGIGTSSPAAKLDVQGSAIFARVKSTATTYNGFRAQNDNGNFYFGLDDAAGGFYGTANARVLYADGAYPMVFYTNATERMRLDSAGNLGLGVTPSAWNSNYKAFETSSGSLSGQSGAVLRLMQNAYVNAASNFTYVSTAAASFYQQTGGIHAWYNAPSGTAATQFSPTQAMTLDASGRLLVGKTTSGSVANIGVEISTAYSMFSASNTGSDPTMYVSVRGASGALIDFYHPTGGRVGGISTNGTITVYSTTSDYRLKTVIGPVANAGQRIDALEPIEYEWKADGSRTRGFLAHKFQEVYAGSVIGTKDAVDADGKPVYQSMQASSSEVIADLVAEIQSLRKRLTALEQK